MASDEQRGHLVRGMPAVQILLESVSLMALPAAALALGRGNAEVALFASVLASAASALRAFVTGAAIDASLRRTWARAVRATRGRSLPHLRTRSENDESVPVLMEAIREVAVYQAVTVPHLIALGVALVAMAVAIVVVLGARWLLIGVGALSFAGVVIVVGRAKLRPIQEESWRAYGDLVLDLRVLLDASAEVRAHGKERDLGAALLERVTRVARAERIGVTWSAAVATLPVAIAILALAAPLRAGVGWIVELLAANRVLDAGILGGAGLAVGLALVNAAQSALRSAPHRATLAEFLRAGEPPTSPGPPPSARAGTLRGAAIRFERLAFVYDGSTVATPAGVDFDWTGPGLALIGDNGAGKSTLALLLLGLLHPTAGAVTLDGAPLSHLDLDELRARVAYAPQNIFVAPGASVAWHMRLFAPRPMDDATLDAALERVGLAPVLAEHARRTGVHPREVAAGELSGGERQRMSLARVWAQCAELVILDEPEAGLDASWREQLREFVAELSERSRVLVIAHDPSVIPASFERLVCRRGAA